MVCLGLFIEPGFYLPVIGGNSRIHKIRFCTFACVGLTTGVGWGVLLGQTMAARGILRANRVGFLAKGKGVPANRV